jgi:uncharacterized protein
MKAAALGVAGAAGLLVYARQIEPDRITLKPLRFWHQDVPRAFHGYKIAQFSDVHLDGSRHSVNRLGRTVDLINAAEPDLIVCTGDFATQVYRGYADDLTTHLQRLRAPDGVLAILGNHDHRYNRLMTQRVLTETGITELNNCSVTLQRGDDLLHIAGVGSVTRQRARLDKAMGSIPSEGMAILLAHEPDFADVAAATGRFTLQLSGHTHGGQINLPYLLDFSLPAYGRRYVGGIYNVSGMWLYVNRGIGMSGLPLRLRARPEITLFTLGILNLG